MFNEKHSEIEVEYVEVRNEEKQLKIFGQYRTKDDIKSFDLLISIDQALYLSKALYTGAKQTLKEE